MLCTAHGSEILKTALNLQRYYNLVKKICTEIMVPNLWDSAMNFQKLMEEGKWWAMAWVWNIYYMLRKYWVILLRELFIFCFHPFKFSISHSISSAFFYLWDILNSLLALRLRKKGFFQKVVLFIFLKIME